MNCFFLPIYANITGVTDFTNLTDFTGVTNFTSDTDEIDKSSENW